MKKLSSDISKIYEGLAKAANAVGSTIGPDGRNVFIGDPFSPKMTNDGARIADAISIEDPVENVGAFLVKNCAAKTNDDVGDGTTTTVVLLQAILEECRKRPENPSVIRRSLNEAVKEATKLLKKKAVPITKKDVKEVALISGEYEDLAQIIHDIINKLGGDAHISVEDSQTYETSYEIVEGYEAKVGFVSPWFSTNSKTQKAEYDDIPIFVSSKKIGNVQNIAPLTGELTKMGIHHCAFFVPEIDEKVLAVLIANKIQGKFDSVVVRANKEELEDIAGATGAVPLGEESGVDFTNLKTAHLGKAHKLTVDAHTTVIIADSINAIIRASELDVKAEEEPNQFLKQRIKERAARLRGKIGIIKIGAKNDLSREHKKDKAEDAIKAVPAALEGGLVEGAGKAWVRVADELKGKSIGEQILKKALKRPYEKILENSGGLPEDEAVVRDPAKVECVALENAVEAASIFITTSYAIIEEEKGK